MERKNNENLSWSFVKRSYGTDEYEIKGGEGMTTQEIIDTIDPNNFGGARYGSRVLVYID